MIAFSSAQAIEFNAFPPLIVSEILKNLTAEEQRKFSLTSKRNDRLATQFRWKKIESKNKELTFNLQEGASAIENFRLALAQLDKMHKISLNFSYCARLRLIGVTYENLDKVSIPLNQYTKCIKEICLDSIPSNVFVEWTQAIDEKKFLINDDDKVFFGIIEDRHQPTIETKKVTRLDLSIIDSWRNDQKQDFYIQSLPKSLITTLTLCETFLSKDYERFLSALKEILPETQITTLYLHKVCLDYKKTEFLKKFIPWIKVHRLICNGLSDNFMKPLMEILPHSKTTNLDLCSSQNDVGIKNIENFLPGTKITHLDIYDGAEKNIFIDLIGGFPKTRVTHLTFSCVSDKELDIFSKILPQTKITTLRFPSYYTHPGKNLSYKSVAGVINILPQTSIDHLSIGLIQIQNLEDIMKILNRTKINHLALHFNMLFDIKKLFNALDPIKECKINCSIFLSFTRIGFQASDVIDYCNNTFPKAKFLVSKAPELMEFDMEIKLTDSDD